MIIGETAFTRMPHDAYSIASALVTEFKPPLANDANAAGTPLTGCSATVAVMFTI